ncbi:zinc transporter 11-like [Rhododendron vialii]|uniref:zinc transporter 11-like n=1 Tax=Rhododendron vialii TaxID=182163 RepID=UPI0026601F7D|nr:zinc transporter 11-like [Rhododendron vialii]
MSKLLSLLPLLSLLLLSAAAHGDHSDADSDSDSPPPNLRTKPLVLVKIWCLILVFIGTFVGGISPYFMRWNEGFLVLGTQFAGGVFLGTAMMHFLSDSNETFGDLTSKPYPFAFMLACAGYLITMFVDCVISHVFGKNGNGGGELHGGGDVEIQGYGRGSSTGMTTGSQYQGHGSPHNHFVEEEDPLATSAISLGDCILLIVALCFHSVFEGIAIGVAETEANAWKALWTICLHKIFAAIAMGIALLRMIPDRPLLSCAAYAFAFAISSPIGVAIGIVIDATTQGAVADWIYAISMALACGVFFYVSINHLLAKGYLPQKLVLVDMPFYKFLAVLLGIGVIAVVMIWDT